MKEVEGTPIAQNESSEREFHMVQLRKILERQGLALSDEDFATLCKRRGTAIAGKGERSCGKSKR